jgi:hypothetical protein
MNFAPDLAPDLVIFDGRQSPTAAAVQRGVCRMLRMAGFAMLTEFALASGRRADVIAISPKGRIVIVEIKSSLADYRADVKWPEYWAFCDQLFFAIPTDLAPDIIPPDAGLIVADAWGAEIVRCPSERPLPAARRKSLTLGLARAAALRLHSVHDPRADL